MFPSPFIPCEYKATFLPKENAMPIKLRGLGPNQGSKAAHYKKNNVRGKEKKEEKSL